MHSLSRAAKEAKAFLAKKRFFFTFTFLKDGRGAAALRVPFVCVCVSLGGGLDVCVGKLSPSTRGKRRHWSAWVEDTP